MEVLNGLEIKIQDLKKEPDGTFTLFKQFQNLMQQNNLSDDLLKNNLLSQYEKLIISKEDEIVGVKEGKQETITKIPGGYNAAQQMFLPD